MLVDNNYVPGSNHPITRTDIQGNTYQRRSLDDGSTWEVLKNFPTPTELSAQLARHGTEAQIRSLEYYWTRPSGPTMAETENGGAFYDDGQPPSTSPIATRGSVAPTP